MGGRIVLIFGRAGQKVAILVWCSENVLILGMARVRSGDFMYDSGFVSNPVNKTLICSDFLFNPCKNAKYNLLAPKSPLVIATSNRRR